LFNQEKKEEEASARQAQPSAIPGYFDPMAVNIYFPSPPNGQDVKTANFNM